MSSAYGILAYGVRLYSAATPADFQADVSAAFTGQATSNPSWGIQAATSGLHDLSALSNPIWGVQGDVVGSSALAADAAPMWGLAAAASGIHTLTALVNPMWGIIGVTSGLFTGYAEITYLHEVLLEGVVSAQFSGVATGSVAYNTIEGYLSTQLVATGNPYMGKFWGIQQSSGTWTPIVDNSDVWVKVPKDYSNPWSQ